MSSHLVQTRKHVLAMVELRYRRCDVKRERMHVESRAIINIDDAGCLTCLRHPPHRARGVRARANSSLVPRRGSNSSVIFAFKRYLTNLPSRLEVNRSQVCQHGQPDQTQRQVPPQTLTPPNSHQASESRLYTFSQETKDALRKFRLSTSRAKDPQAIICEQPLPANKPS